MCVQLTNAYNDPNLRFEPEHITEGGIVFRFNNIPYFYKTVRFTNNENWPAIEPDDVWENNNEIALSKKNMDNYGEVKSKYVLRTCLKAFEGAPIFTVEELQIWENVFANFGLKRKGRKTPKKNLLCPVIAYQNPELVPIMQERKRKMFAQFK